LQWPPRLPRSNVVRRCLLSLLAWLLLGAIVNVAVAWACALQQPTTSRGLFGNSFQQLNLHPPAGWLEEAASLERAIHRVATLYVHRNDRVSAGLLRREIGFARGMPDAAAIVRSGLPCYSMEAGCWYDWGAGPALNAGRSRHRVLWAVDLKLAGDGRLSAFDRRLLPLRPLWPGFAINTIFYGGAAWLLFVAPFAARRAARRWRNRCVSCGYDLRGSAHERCPECGAMPRR